MVATGPSDPDRLRAFREALPAVAAGIYLNTAVAGPLPAETAAAMAEIADHELRFGRGHPADLEDAAVRREEARAALAAVLSTDVGTVALAHGSRDALAAAVRSVDWSPGDGCLTTDAPGSDIEAVADAIAQGRGVRVERVGIADTDDAAIARAIRDRAAAASPRLVLLPHVDAAGRLLPVRDVADALRGSAPGVPVVVDGRLAVGALPVAVDAIGVDAYAVAGDAWLLGPSATGGLWLSANGLRRLGAGVGPSRDRRAAAAATDLLAFEPAELATGSVVGLARSVGWLSMFVGLEWLLSRPTALADRLLRGLRAIPNVQVVTPPEPASRGPVAVFRIAGWHPDDAIAELGRRVFAILGAVVLHDGPAVRASLGAFNDERELDRLLDAVELLASHTAETLPRRTALTILRG